MGARRARRGLIGLLVVAAVVASASAQASNALTPRTPPIFKREACLTIVDRSVDPVFHLDFAIPYEDAMLTPDELPDSRRFQFFAVCRQRAFGETLPNWALLDDAERALAAEIILELPDADDVLELAPAWSHDADGDACIVAMNDAADRIPITCEATEGALDWDTTDAPAGNYVILGHTFEPELNLWESRRGVVQIVDESDQRFPVVSIMFPARDGTRAYEGDGYRVVGCMDGPPGTTVTLSWAAASRLGGSANASDDAWEDFAVLDAGEASFDLVFDVPPEAVQQAVIFRGVAQTLDGRAWTGYAPYPLIVYPGEGESEPPYKPAGPDFCGYYPDDEGDTTGGSDAADDDADPPTGSSTASSHGAESSESTGGNGGGCSCRVDRTGHTAWLHAIGLLALAAVSRRRSSPHP